MSQKRCGKCKEWKPLGDFNKDKYQKDGHQSRCRICQAVKRKEHYQENREKEIEKVKRYRNERPEWVKEYNKLHYENNHEYHLKRSKEYKEKNREIIIAKVRQKYKDNREKEIEKVKNYQRRNKDKMAKSGKQYRESHRDKVRAIKKDWDSRNRDKASQYSNKRRAHAEVNGGNYTAQEWKSLCDFYGNVCLRCSIHAKDTLKGKLSPDHIIPLSKGGSNDISNIQPLCLPCNISKHDKIIDYRP